VRIHFEYEKEYSEITSEEQQKLNFIKETIEKKESMLDWKDISSCISVSELEHIKKTAKQIQQDFDTFIVVGIGGSYMGSKAVIESLKPYFSTPDIEVIFAGYQLSSAYLKELLQYIEGKNVAINVISKSGNTLEPAATFQILLDYMKSNYLDYQERIFVTTDKDTGSLRKLATEEGFQSFEVPKNIGGRYSVLTPVGLLPLAVAGIDIDMLLNGARSMENDCFRLASQVAITRYHLEQNNKNVEAFTIYDEKLSSFGLWYQQLFAETQGKNQKGILPFVNLNTTNLHSIGQYLQDGTRNVFETVLKVENMKDISLTHFPISMHQLNNIVLEQVLLAHQKGGTPSILIEIDEITAFTIGQLILFFELTAAIGGYLLDVNPFDQPGVEEYKKLVNNELNKIKDAENIV